MNDGDRKLADRLRAYEAAVPEGSPPAPQPDRRPPWAIFAVAATGVLVTGVVIWSALLAGPRTVGEADPTSAPSFTAQPTTSAQPTEAASPTPVPSDSPSGTAVESPSAAVFEELLRIDAGTNTALVNAIQPFGDGQLIAAVNTSNWEYMPATASHGMSGSTHLRSREGGWQRIDTGDVFGDVEISDIFSVAGGGLVLYGEREGFESVEIGVGFTSNDGRSWEPIAGIPWESEFGAKIAEGPLGFLAVVGAGGQVRAYLSSDAVTWDLAFESPESEEYDVFDAGAGSEGYVISARQTFSGGADSRNVTFASGDGETWIRSSELQSEFGTPLWSITAFGADWVGAGFSNEGTGIPVFWSANGLDWTFVATIDDPADREYFGYAAHLVATDERLFLSAGFQGEGIESRPAGTWTSTDGRTWSPVPIGDYTEVRAVAADGSGTYIVGRAESGVFDAVGGAALIWSMPD